MQINRLSSGQRITKNFLSLSGGKVLTSIATFFTTIYLARNLHPEGFGEISFALIIITYFILISNMGLNTLGVREVAKAHNQLKRWIENIIPLRIFLSIISYFCLLIFVFFIPKPLELKALILLYGLSIFPMALFLDWAFKGIEKMEMVAIAQIIRVWFYLGLVLLLIKTPDDIMKVPILFFISFLSAVLFLWSLLRKGEFIPQIDLKFWKYILKEAFPMGFSFIMVQIYYNIDIVMIGFMKGSKDVGWYNAAYKIVLFIVGFASLFGQSIYPKLSQLSKKDLMSTKRFITATHKIALLAGLPTAIILFILGPKIIISVYGANYQPSIFAFQILVWSIFTVFCNIPFAYSLLAFGKQKYYMYAVSSGAGVNIILNFLLIPHFGIIGASITTMISEFLVLSLFYAFFVRNIVYINFLEYSYKISLVSVIVGVITYFCRFNIWLAFSCGTLAFFILVVILKIVTKEEIVKYWKGAKDVKPL